MKKTALLAILMTIGLVFLTNANIGAWTPKMISGIVVSVHLSPGSFDGPSAIVKFADGRTKVFAYNNLIYEIRPNEFNTIYYDELDRITRIEIGFDFSPPRR